MSHTAQRALQRKMKGGDRNAEYAASNFLIYSCFNTIPKPGQSSIGGSVLMGSAMTQEEADEKVAEFTRRSNEFAAIHPLLYVNTTTRYAIIANQEDWWYEYSVAE